MLFRSSIAGAYDTTKQIRMTGAIREFHFVNPHPFLVLDVDSPKPGAWKLEMDNRWELAGIGVSENTFQAGDRVTVSGSPGRAEAQTLYVRRLDRPRDGFWYEQVGTEPRIRGSKR